MNRKNPLWKFLDISGLVVGFAALSISLLDSLGILNIIPDEWYPGITVLLLSALTIYIVLERRLVLDTLAKRVDEISEGTTVEIASNRSQTYRYVIEAASEGTPSNPIRHVKIYAPRGFSHVDEDKQRWLDTLKQLVIARRVTDVEAIYGIPQSKTSLIKAANFLMRFFYHTDDNDVDQATSLRNHVYVGGTMLGSGLGIPRGFGIIVIEDKLLMIGYARSRGDEYVQKALVTRNKAAIKDMSDWFDSHAYVGSLRVLQECNAEKNIGLHDELSRILRDQEIPESVIEEALSNKLLSYDEIKAMGI